MSVVAVVVVPLLVWLRAFTTRIRRQINCTEFTYIDPVYTTLMMMMMMMMMMDDDYDDDDDDDDDDDGDDDDSDDIGDDNSDG